MPKVEKLLDAIEAAQKEIKANDYKSAIVLGLEKLFNKFKKS